MAQLDQTPNFTDLYAQAFQTGQAAAKAKGVQNALAMSPTDPVGAQAELVRYGAFPEANALAQVSASQRDLALKAKAGPLIQNGDYAGASGVLAAGGDYAGASDLGKLGDQHIAQAAHITDVMAQALHGLTQLPEDQATRQAGVDKITPYLQSAGVPQALIDKARSGDLSNNGINAMASSVLSLKDQIATEQKTREDAEIARHNQATENPIHYATLKDQMGNESLVTAGGAPGAAGSAPPAAAGSPADALWAAVKTQESGNRPGVTGPQTAYGQAQGLTQMLPKTAEATALKLGVPWQPELMTGTSPEAAAYQEKLGRAYFDEGIQAGNGDPRQALMHYYGGPDPRLWGPKTHAYADQVMARAAAAASPGGGPTPQTQPFQVASNGPTPFPAQAAPAATPGGARVLYSTATPAASAATSNLTGQDYLKTLPANQARTVQALAEGRMQFPNGFALKQPYWQNMMSAVGQYDPQFDAVNYNARSKARADFTSGKSAQNITAINTLVGHLGSLDTAIDNLHNLPFPIMNSFSNSIENAIGNPAVTNFNAIKTAVVDELPKVFQGNGGALGDRTAWESKLDAAQSPPQLHGVVKQLVELLGSRVSAIGDTYNAGMGTTKDPMELLHPEAAATLQRLSGQGGSGQAAPAPQAAQAPAASGPRLTVQQAAALKPGTPFVGMDGVARVRH